jgi:hypothetical protein
MKSAGRIFAQANNVPFYWVHPDGRSWSNIWSKHFCHPADMAGTYPAVGHL